MMKNFNLQDVFFFLILISLSIGFFYIVSPFLVDIFIAIVLVILFKKPYAFFKRKTKNKIGLSASLTIFTVIFTIIIPIAFVGFMVTKEATNNYIKLRDNWPEIEQEITSNFDAEKLKKNKVYGEYIDKIDWEMVAKKTNELATKAAQFFISIVQNTFVSFTYLLIHFFIVLFILYFLFIDGDELLNRVQYLIPLNDEDERELFNKLEKVTDAIVLNTFMIGAIEGTYGALLFLVLGVPSPFFWGVLMVILSIIPLVGANSILVPMAIIQLIIGNYTTGILILIFGVGAILINQNLVRPRLDGNKSGMHPAIIFLASMGGLVTMGIIGFLAGPMLTALFLVIWHQFGIRYKERLELFNKS